MSKLTSIPILGVQLWFDRPVVREAGVALVDRDDLSGVMGKGLQWLFRKDPEGKVVQGVISAAEDFVGLPKAVMLARFEKQVIETCRRKGLAGNGVPKLLRGNVVIEKRATFAPVPGGDLVRPAQGPGENGVKGLYLAGDYTKTDWPATMEGAVRGGYLAAEAVLGDLGRMGEGGGRRRVLVQDLAVEWPARLMGL